MAHSFRQVAVECNDPSATFEKQEVLLKALVGIQNAVCNNPATPPTGSPRMVLTVRNSCSLNAAVTVTAQGTNQAVQVHICEGRVADGLDGKMESSKYMGGVSCLARSCNSAERVVHARACCRGPCWGECIHRSCVGMHRSVGNIRAFIVEKQTAF